MALWILDIDPSFTLGDLEREKIETLNKLKEEGIFDSNKLVNLPLLPQRIAIISVDTSRGYADFLRVVQNNPWHYKFFHLLFPAILQGDNAVASIIHQLRRISKVIHHFDVVAIIRGGGGDIGLSCYNNYSLAREIALFPIPVMTGIGHATNETVAEMISHSTAITPTKLAEQLLQKFHNFSVPVQEAQKKVTERSLRLLREQNLRFQSEIKLFKSVTQNLLGQNKSNLSRSATSVSKYSQFLFNRVKEYLSRVGPLIEKYSGNFLGRHKSMLINV